VDDLAPYLQTALRAAREAGAIHLSHLGGDLEIDHKTTDSDLVTLVDRASEARIREVILEAHPGHEILGEEEGLGADGTTGGGRFRWVVDPLDGTVNYAHGFPFFCVSVALEIDGRAAVGVVYDPTRDETFVATRGGGATLNGRKISVSALETLGGRALLATGFPYDVEGALHNLELLRRFFRFGMPVRRPGAAALDLCYVACGRLDGFWENKLKPWDCAAGNLIIEEAGGRVSNGSGGPYRPEDRPLVASNGRIHDAMLEVLNSDD
jgi:myo-inositol-1(or 4)-monophosphatase